LESASVSLGLSLHSGPYGIVYAARHPERVNKLVLFNSYARMADGLPSNALAGLANLARADWELATRTLADFSVRRSSEKDGLELAAWFRESCGGAIAAQLFDTYANLDVTSFLP